jgi:hypothetical protein
MPYDIEWRQRGVVKHFHGVVNGRDLLASEEEITGHPDYPSLRYVVSVYVAAERMAATLEERTNLRALRLGGFSTNPHIRFAFATTDPIIRRNVESSVEEGEALHATRVFDSVPAAMHWAMAL